MNNSTNPQAVKLFNFGNANLTPPSTLPDVLPILLGSKEIGYADGFFISDGGIWGVVHFYKGMEI